MTTRGEREAAGARPFQPFPDRPKGKGKMQYYSVPAAILEDGDALMAWAKQAIAIARAQRTRSAYAPLAERPFSRCR